MSAVVTGLCFRCGGPVAVAAATCPYCGMPVVQPPLSSSPPIAPAYFAGPAGPGPALTAGPAPRERLGRRGLVAIGLVALLLVGGGTAALTARLRSTAVGTVHDYFAAVAAGDGTRALRYVQTPDQFRLADYPLLGNGALADAAHRPTAFHLGRATPLSGAPPGVDASAVTATYRVGGQTVTQPVVVLHTADGYFLQSPFVEVAVRNAAGRPITVNGVALNDQQLDTVGYPGSFAATAAGTALFAAGSAAATPPQPGPRLPIAPLDVGAPVFPSGALAEIQRQARTELDACAASVQPAPPGCPFGLDVPGTAPQVRWTITTYPAVAAAVAPTFFGTVGVPVTDDHTGKVHWDVTYTGVDGRDRHETGDLAFTVNGSAQLTGAGIHVSLAG